MAQGIRKLIYLPSSEIWESIRAEAKLVDRSVSNYLVSLHKANMSQGKRVVVSHELEAEFRQKPEPQPDQHEMKKTEEKIKSSPAKKIESEKPSKEKPWVNPLANSVLAPKDQQEGKKVKK